MYFIHRCSVSRAYGPRNSQRCINCILILFFFFLILTVSSIRELVGRFGDDYSRVYRSREGNEGPYEGPSLVWSSYSLKNIRKLTDRHFSSEAQGPVILFLDSIITI